MREFCKTLREMVLEERSDDDINNTINDMMEQVCLSHELVMLASCSFVVIATVDHAVCSSCRLAHLYFLVNIMDEWMKGALIRV